MSGSSLIVAFGKLSFFLALMVALPVVISFTAEYPRPVTERYLDKDNVYWKIEQITISPIFDEPETSRVELYFQKPDKLYLDSEKRKIMAVGDTIWNYIVPHKQIQISLTGSVFNPFDFIDTTRSQYELLKSENNVLTLRSFDNSLEPDSVEVEFSAEGLIKNVTYLDVNQNEVKLIFLDESFEKLIPQNNFLVNIPEDVEVVDLGDE